MTDKQFLQRMRKMVKKTHWIKGSLQRVLQFEYKEDGSVCKLENGRYKAGKYGHCIIGLVAEVGGVPYTSENYDPSPLETRLKDYPQAARITERLYKNLPENTRSKSSYSMAIQEKAYFVEGYNDSAGTQRDDIIALLDRAIANK